MIAVIFELEPAEGRETDYFDRAAELSSLLPGRQGFLGVERFVSLTNPGKYLSLSFFADEDALARWRNESAHRNAQRAGRAAIFADYRLRIAKVVRDYGMHDRDHAPADSRSAHGGA